MTDLSNHEYKKKNKQIDQQLIKYTHTYVCTHILPIKKKLNWLYEIRNKQY